LCAVCRERELSEGSNAKLPTKLVTYLRIGRVSEVKHPKLHRPRNVMEPCMKAHPAKAFFVSVAGGRNVGIDIPNELG
jgi:hypothetical protein